MIRRRIAMAVAAAVALAARSSLSSDQRRYLQDCYEAVHAADRDHFRPFDARFHIALAEVTGSPSLASTVADARAAASELLDAIPYLDKNIHHSDEQHAAILQAVLTGDADTARSVMEEHLEGTAALLRGFLAAQ